MENLNAIQKIRKFIEKEIKAGKTIHTYQNEPNLSQFFENANVGIDLGNFKEIILKEETQLELGGVNKKSFSLVYPINELELIQDGQITLIGPEINEITGTSIDFSLFILIGTDNISEKEFDALRHFTFISDGIEGFMIRTIPRRFWCRISKDIIHSFSFELLGRAITHLYKQQFKNLIQSMEVIYISSYPELIDEFMELTLEIRNYLNSKWKEKIDKWKKRIDCDYDWECNTCPYYDTCEEVKDVLDERSKIGD